MTNEELMMPRYKVIADYPSRPETMPIGHILTLNKFSAGKWWHEYTDDEPLHLEENSQRNYPAILRKLEWFEDLDIKDMPLYLISTYTREINKVHRYEFVSDTIHVYYPEGICKFNLKVYLLTRFPTTQP